MKRKYENSVLLNGDYEEREKTFLKELNRDSEVGKGTNEMRS